MSAGQIASIDPPLRGWRMETRQSFTRRHDLVHSFPRWHSLERKDATGTSSVSDSSSRNRFLDGVAPVVGSRYNQNLLLDFYLCWLVKWG